MSTEESSRRAYARGERPRPVRRHGFEVRASATSTPWSGHVPTCHHLGGIQRAWKRWLNRIGGRSAVLVGSGPAGRRGHWGERAAHARELRDRAHLRRRQALSPLDFRAHAVTEYDNHPIGVLIAHCGHLLPMVVEVDAAPPGRPALPARG